MRRGQMTLRAGLAIVLLGSTACASLVPREEIIAAVATDSGELATTSDGADAGRGGPSGSSPSEDDGGGATQGANSRDAGAAGGDASGDAPAPTAAAEAPTGDAEESDGVGRARGGVAATLSPIRLGHIGTYSGVLGAIFAGGRETLQAWARATNADGGLNGHPVQVVTADDGGDPSRALALARDMVENQGVIAFVGNIQPLSILGIRSYLEERQIPLVGGDLTDEGWFSSPMFFPQGGIVSGSVRAAATPAVQHGGPRIGLLYCGESNACFTARDVYRDGAAEAAGGRLAYTAQVSLAQTSFTAECVAMRGQVDAVIVATDGHTLSRVARDCRQQGVTPLWVSFGLALVNSLAEDPNLDGLVGTSSQFPWFLSDGPTAAYAQAMATHAPGVGLSGATAAVWGAGELMAAASRTLPAEEPTAADVLTGLYGLDAETLGGIAPPLTFAPGQPARPIECHWLIAIDDGRFVAPNGMERTCK